MTDAIDTLSRHVDKLEHGDEPPPPGDESAPDGLVLDPGAPLVSARAFLAARHTLDGQPTLHHHAGDFLAWERSHYRTCTVTELEAQLYSYLDGAQRWAGFGESRRLVPFQPTRAKVANVSHALTAITNLADGSERWVGGEPLAPADDILACANALLHLPTRKSIEHTPRFLNRAAVSFDYSPGAPPPREWLAFLSGLWPSDTEAIETLQEIFGYLLTPDTRQQKIFMLVGPKRSGKGTIARVLVELLGRDNAAAPTLSSLGSNFGVAPLIGKRLAMVTDARLGGRADQQAIAERLLSISGEDAQTIDRKNRSAWTGKLSARFLILTNEIPRIIDSSGALASRFIVLTLRHSFYGHEDHGLTSRLLGELPGILNWALDGLDRLRQRGHFRQPRSSEEAIQALHDLGSPIAAFARDRCQVGPGRRVGHHELYQEWRSWCEAEGRDHAGTQASFGRDLHAAFSGVRTVRSKQRDGGRARFYEGIGLGQEEGPGRSMDPGIADESEELPRALFVGSEPIAQVPGHARTLEWDPDQARRLIDEAVNALAGSGESAVARYKALEAATTPAFAARDMAAIRRACEAAQGAA